MLILECISTHGTRAPGGALRECQPGSPRVPYRRMSNSHTCQLSGIGTESPSFSSRQNLRPRRPKSPSLSIGFFFSFSGHHFVFSSYNPDYCSGQKQGWRLDEVGRHVQEIQMQEK